LAATVVLVARNRERFIARKASDGEPFFVAALLRMTAEAKAKADPSLRSG
jgi:hypothetical protein